MDPVTILIFNSLAKKESVYLPQIGLLHVVAIPAGRDSNGAIVPPVNDVKLSETGDGLSIIEIIMSKANKDQEFTERVYNKWLGEVSDNGIIRIESVGAISDGHFTIAKELQSALNPLETVKSSVKRPGGKVNLTMTIVLAAIVGAAISIGVITYLDHNSRYEKKFKAPKATVTPATHTTQSAIKDTSATASLPETVTTSIPTATTQAEVSGTAYYVIIGNFSVEENADRFIVECRKKDGSLEYRKLPLSTGKVMVYTSSWPTEEEAKRHRLLGHYPEAWVYKHTK